MDNMELVLLLFVFYQIQEQQRQSEPINGVLTSNWTQRLARMEPQVSGFQDLGWKWAITPNANMQNLGWNPGWTLQYKNAIWVTCTKNYLVRFHTVRSGQNLSGEYQRGSCGSAGRGLVCQAEGLNNTHLGYPQSSSKIFNIILEEILQNVSEALFKRNVFMKEKRKQKFCIVCMTEEKTCCRE